MRNNYIKRVLKNKTEWLKAKELTIGGSEASAIVNQSKWLTPLDIYSKMVLGKTKVIPENERMHEGTLAEKHIRDMFALEHKEYKVINPPVRNYWLFIRKDKPYLSVTPDGMAIEVDNPTKIWGIEVKDIELRKKEDINAWESNVLPNQYYFQGLHYLVVKQDFCGVIFVVRLKYYSFDNVKNKWYHSHSTERYFFLDKSNKDVQAHISYLEKKETEFYEQNILGRKRPKLVIKF